MSVQSRQAAGTARRGDGADGARMAKARRNAWVLAGLAAFFYVAYMAWIIVHAGGG